MNTSGLEPDILFSPERWSKRFPAKIVFWKHLEFITKYSDLARSRIPCHLNIPYGERKREMIDIYGTDLADDAPILLHIHGGYWQEETLTHTNNSFPALSLHNYGIKYISVGYELCPNTNLHGIVNNIELAVYKCLEYAKRLKSRGLYLSGHSAGAHLVASLFKNFIPTLSTEDQKLFKSAFLLCGLYDLSPLVESQANQIIGLDEESAEDASPIHYSNFGTETSFHVVVAQHDSPVFRRQGKRLNDHIMSLGLHSRYILVENVDHYEIVEKLTEEEFPLTRHIVNVIIG